MRGADSLSKAECARLIVAVGDGPLAVRDLAMLEVMAATGLRVSELAALKVSQVMTDGQIVDTLHLVRAETKRNRGGKLPVSERLKATLTIYLKWLRRWSEGEWLFPGYDGRHLTPRAVQLRVKRWRIAAGLGGKKISPHSLRKYFIEQLMASGLGLRTVMELSRHADLSSLHSYLVVDEAAAARAVEGVL